MKTKMNATMVHNDDSLALYEPFAKTALNQTVGIDNRSLRNSDGMGLA